MKVPTALAVVVIGAAAFAGCPDSKRVPIDARLDDARADGSLAGDASGDAAPADASPDARPADAPPDTPVV